MESLMFVVLGALLVFGVQVSLRDFFAARRHAERDGTDEL